MDRRQIEHHVEQILVRQGVRKERMSSKSRLRHDLGLDGDEAREFFSALAARFGTDLTVLEEDWGRHFGVDGLAVRPMAVMAACGGIIGAAAMLVGLPAGGAVVFAAVSAGVVIWLMGRRGSTGSPAPVTLADVVDAVVRGRWERPSDTAR